MQALELVGEGWKVFDVGCSSGNFGEELIKRKNCVVDGIDPDQKDTEIARTKLRRVEAITAEDEKLYEFFPEKYDAILFIDVIEHLANPVEVLERVKNMLKKDGVIIFSIPNMAYVSVRYALLRGEFDYTNTGLLDQTHLHFYTGKYIQKVFNKAGYSIKNFQCSSFTYPEFQSKEILARVGLKPNKKFFNLLEDTGGYVYQYVGSSVVAAKVPEDRPAPKLNAHEKDYKVVNETINNYKKHIKHLSEAVKLKDQHIINLEKIIQGQKEQLDRSTLSKIVSKVKSVKAKVKH